jgi:hypothetical protein
MAGYVMRMNILVSNKYQYAQKDMSFEVRHKAYASRYGKFNRTVLMTIERVL